MDEVYDALEVAGFTKVGRTTHAGKVKEYVFFNAEGVRVEIDFRYAKTQPTYEPGEW